MKIALISNNFGEIYDGVGAYAKVLVDNLPDDVSAVVYTAKCRNDMPKIQKIFNFGMTKAILQATKNVKRDDADAYLIEYPFMEWNPFMLVATFLLSRKVKKSGRLLCASLHEYGRVKRPRQMAGRIICKLSDMVLVTNNDLKDEINGFINDDRIYLRELPSNIWSNNISDNVNKKDPNSFVYFGLINQAKAFYEMIEGWNRVTEGENRAKLYVLSSSSVCKEVKEIGNVELLQNADDDSVIQIMKGCAFCFLPVKPYVDLKNSTFKTATLAGCICVGKFCDELKDLPFVIQMSDYTPEDFIKAYNIAISLTDDKVKDKARASSDYGRRFSPPDTIRKMIETIKDYLGYEQNEDASM